MRGTTSLTTLAAALLIAGGASAQILGGSGSITGSAQVQAPPLGSTVGPATGVVRDTVRDTRDTVRDTVDATRDTNVRADVSVAADARADGSQGGASTSADLGFRAGLRVEDFRGRRIGTVDRLTTSADGTVQRLMVRSGSSLYAVPIDAVSLRGDVAVTSMTAAELRRR